MSEYSKYQQRVIKNFYDNRETLALQRVQELVTELYLSEGKQREKHWKSLDKHLEKLGVPRPQIDHLIKQNRPDLVARFVQGIMEKK